LTVTLSVQASVRAVSGKRSRASAFFVTRVDPLP
jgi:hypothetical protein